MLLRTEFLEQKMMSAGQLCEKEIIQERDKVINEVGGDKREDRRGNLGWELSRQSGNT